MFNIAYSDSNNIVCSLHTINLRHQAAGQTRTSEICTFLGVRGGGGGGVRYLSLLSEPVKRNAKCLADDIQLLGGLLSPSISMVFDFGDRFRYLYSNNLTLEKNSQIYFIVPRIYPHYTLPEES